VNDEKSSRVSVCKACIVSTWFCISAYRGTNPNTGGPNSNIHINFNRAAPQLTEEQILALLANSVNFNPLAMEAIRNGTFVLPNAHLYHGANAVNFDNVIAAEIRNQDMVNPRTTTGDFFDRHQPFSTGLIVEHGRVTFTSLFFERSAIPEFYNGILVSANAGAHRISGNHGLVDWQINLLNAQAKAGVYGTLDERPRGYIGGGGSVHIAQAQGHIGLPADIGLSILPLPIAPAILAHSTARRIPLFE
jgi:hypothetical protein